MFKTKSSETKTKPNKSRQNTEGKDGAKHHINPTVVCIFHRFTSEPSDADSAADGRRASRRAAARALRSCSRSMRAVMVSDGGATILHFIKPPVAFGFIYYTIERAILFREIRENTFSVRRSILPTSRASNPR